MLDAWMLAGRAGMTTGGGRGQQEGSFDPVRMLLPCPSPALGTLHILCLPVHATGPSVSRAQLYFQG